MTNISTTEKGERFGYEWSKYSTILPIYEEQFLKWTTLLSKEDWRGASYLDVGCGMGRNSYWPMTYGASGGVAADVDDRSLEMARRNLQQFPSVQVQRMSAYSLEPTNHFDIVFSIGVIHHLDDPEAAVRSMAEAAKPGGTVLIWVYGFENNEWIVRYFDPLRKLLFSRLPIGLVHWLSLFPAAALWAFLRCGGGRIAYFNLLRRMGFPHLRSIVFDQMLPRIARYYRREEATRLLEQAELSDIRSEWVNAMSWCVVGTKAGGEE